MSQISDFLFEYSWREKLRTLLVLLLICLSFSIPFGHDYGRKMIAVIFLLWILVIKKEEIIYLLKHKVIITLLLFLGIHYISLLWSEHLRDGLYYIRVMWMYLFFPLVIYITILTKNNMKYIITAFVLGMFINEIISYLIYFDLYQTEYSKTHDWPMGFVHHIVYSVFIAFCSILVLNQVKYIENKYLKIVYVIFVITMTLNLIISGGRTGYVAYFISLFIMLFTYFKVSKKILMQILFLPIVIFFIAYLTNERFNDRVNITFESLNSMYSESNYNTSLGARLAFYPLSKNILDQEHNSYLFGIGTGDIPTELRSSIQRTEFLNDIYAHTHNSYLEAYLNTGILGVLLLIFIFYFLWKINIKDDEIRFIQQLFIIVISVSILSDRLFNIPDTMFFFSLFMAIIIAQEKIERKT